MQVLKVQLGTNIEETNDQFEIDIFMWAIGTQSQNGKSQSAEFARALVYRIWVWNDYSKLSL